MVGRAALVLLVARLRAVGVMSGALAGFAKITATKIAMPKKPTAPNKMSESRVSRMVTVFSLPSSGS